ncbi:hypothetical protein [Bacillus pumilus]|uniref:hypothetical protein n=1 Tax=Bacillus pumilus TaxID=1408 RepID=UPI001E60E156|nr:hypothetical protein [Bacillus pumilus]MCC9088785.1 hypothetical protein [Bacillus pumilus]
MWIYKYDDQYIYTPGEEQILNEGEVLPENYTEIPPPVESYIAKYDSRKREWKETASQEYINSLKVKTSPSDLDLLKMQNAFLTKQITQILQEITYLKLREIEITQQLTKWSGSQNISK